ncbi:uncharacterized protein Bfra_010543 [Botrytis fragariae]|uniref:Uncharacterized protein n=1 Tax=Botrytis fragariae TaxID=1964551 RepID=A0A8H6AHZ9_9HELO|nr:uncharacterized protein Bfra_010543 [Botrytis fragariae]KAF5867568.1 hypothetical protein Bfra_010543 [Botrytis fragariae]
MPRYQAELETWYLGPHENVLLIRKLTVDLIIKPILTELTPLNLDDFLTSFRVSYPYFQDASTMRFALGLTLPCPDAKFKYPLYLVSARRLQGPCSTDFHKITFRG